MAEQSTVLGRLLMLSLSVAGYVCNTLPSLRGRAGRLRGQEGCVCREISARLLINCTPI